MKQVAMNLKHDSNYLLYIDTHNHGVHKFIVADATLVTYTTVFNKKMYSF